MSNPFEQFDDRGFKIHDDQSNPAHDPHFDGIQKLPDVPGVDHFRISPDGDILDGETNVKGFPPIKWED